MSTAGAQELATKSLSSPREVKVSSKRRFIFSLSVIKSLKGSHLMIAIYSLLIEI